jgi:hypothetical protein
MDRSPIRYAMWFQRETSARDKEILARRNRRFRKKLEQYAESSGRMLFDSKWMSEEEATEKFRALNRDSKLKIVEVSVLLVIMFFGTLMPFAVLAILGGIAA